jgi:hypothetical protein
MNKLLSTKIKLLLFLLVCWSATNAQDITLSPLTGGVAVSPLASNATGVAILGVQFDKAAGGTNEITDISFALTSNPVGLFTNPHLYRSDNNNSFDGADLLNEVGTPAFGATSIDFTGGITTFSGNSTATTRRFFLVVDIDNSVTGATAPVTPSVSDTDVTAVGTVTAGTVTGVAYSFADAIPPTITFNPVNGATGVAFTSNITITFSEPVRKLDNSAITQADIEGGLVELRETNSGGTLLTFTASIDGTNKIITINPTSDFVSNSIYYVEMKPVEDSGNNSVTDNITFTSLDLDPPVPTFNPLDGTMNVLETDNIIITFDEPVRKLNNSPITPADIEGGLVELRETNSGGTPVLFTATIDGTNKIITLTPVQPLAGNTLYYVKMNPVEDASNNPSVTANSTFTTDDTLPPSFTFAPTDASINFSAVGNIIITFNEPIQKLDNTAITPIDIQGITPGTGLVELRETHSAGPAVPFTATINGTNTIITINPNSTLLHNQDYYVEMNPVEDVVDNPTVADNITFTTENRPSISSFIPAAAERCIGDPVTINGSRFMGTGNPVTGSTQPTVYINGVAVPALNITSFNATQIIFTMPSVAAGTFPITVRNNDSDLLSAGSSFDVRPAIDVTFPVTPATLSPAQNTSVDIQIGNTQSPSYSYALILNSGPVGYTATTQTTTGNAGARTLTTTPALNKIGDYVYKIDVSRANCVTKTLSNTPFTLTVASLSVNVSATDVSVCMGSSTTLIGAVSGGTGFYQFRWTSNPAGYSSSSSSPTVTPPANIISYNLEVEDNAGNTVTDFVDVVVNPVPSASFIPNPGNPPLIPAETSVRENYVVEDRDYLVSGSPAGGEFTGQGIIKKSDGKYYFNPANAGLGNWPIVYTYTNVNGCQGTDSRTFVVQALSVNGVQQLYCKSESSQSGINVNIANAIGAGYQFTRLRFYAYYNGVSYYDDPLASPFVGTPAANNMPPGASYPLTLNSRAAAPVLDIQTGLPIFLPLNYTLNLDHVRNGWGFGYYYLDVFGKDAFGNEVLQSWAFFRVVDNDPAPNIVGINENQNICADGAVITLSSSEPGYTTTNFTIAPVAFSGSLSGTNNRDFNPAHPSLVGPDQRPLTVTMAYNDYNGCPSTVNRKFNWVKKPNMPFALDTAYCQVTAEGKFFIKGEPSGSADKPIWYEALAPTIPIDSINWTFVATGVTGLVPINKTFLVQQQFKGCRGNTTPVDIEIKPAPIAIFTNTNICEDRDFTLTGPLDVAVPYDLYIWSYDNTQVDSITTTNIQTHNYGPNSANTLKTITLTVVNSVGCKNDFSKTTPVGQNPKPNFTANLICDGDNSVFNNTADIAVEFSWDFGDGVTIAKGTGTDPAPEGGTIKDPVHEFPGPGAYPVTVTSFTAAGCNNPFTKNVTILEYLTHTSAAPYSMASVDGGKGYWTVEDVNGNSSWQFAQATSTLKSKLTTPGWATNPAGNYSANEKSFLNSPCLNIAAIERPVISMDMVLNTQQNFDGAVLEFSDDNGLTWKPTGNVGSGINWFNTSGFFAGNIGNSPVGWSGDSRDLEDNTNRDTLVQARRALDNIGDLSLGERAKVRFRMAFQTNGDRELEGIAFNNVSISSRNRISLVENFTNESDTSNNAAFKLIPGTESAKIQYHIGFPGADPNYQINTIDPSARAGYYGIPFTDQYVPRGYVDGFSDGRFDQPAWIQGRFNKQALKNSPYTLAVSTLPTTDPNYLKVSISVTSLVNIPAGKKPLLQIAVVEKTTGDNEFVLRKLISSAAGRLLASPMPQNTTVIVTDSMRIENNQIDVTDLAIIAFVQDEATKEVYQAGLDLNPANLPNPSVTTSIVDFMEGIQLYPNPANEGFVIELPNKPESQLSVNLIDQLGRPVHELFFEKGEQHKAIDTKNLSEGIYIVQIGSGKAGVVRKKMMIVHKN